MSARRLYILIAAAIRRAVDHCDTDGEREIVAVVAVCIADELARDNRAFDRALFLENSGV